MPGDALRKPPLSTAGAPLVGDGRPVLHTPIPGPASAAWTERLELTECPGSTARRANRSPGTGAPSIVWREALGSNVRDADGNVFVDLCAGFGVASVGHRNPVVVRAGQAQLDVLPHAMGDAFPDVQRILLMEALAGLTGFSRVALGSSGSDAIEVAFKTALLATGRTRVVAFRGGYHGLTSAPLAAIGYQTEARKGPFAGMLGTHVSIAPFGGELPDLSDVAAVVVEPVQGRGGMRAGPPGWLAGVHRAAHRAGALVIHDEVFCGLGRTGTMFAADAELDEQGEGLRPDLLCLGKALAAFGIPPCAKRGRPPFGRRRRVLEPVQGRWFGAHPVRCAPASAPPASTSSASASGCRRQAAACRSLAAMASASSWRLQRIAIT